MPDSGGLRALPTLTEDDGCLTSSDTSWRRSNLGQRQRRNRRLACAGFSLRRLGSASQWRRPARPWVGMGVPGISLTLTTREDGRLSVQHGEACLSPPRRVEPGTVFHLFSGTKLCTAAALMLLVEQRLVSLDDVVTKHLPSSDCRPGRRDPPPASGPQHTAGWERTAS